jgi:hypothetical protein
MYNRFKRLKDLGLTVDLNSIDYDTFETLILIDQEFDKIRSDDLKKSSKRGNNASKR